MAWDFLVAKTDLRQTQFQPATLPDLGADEVRLAVDSFALTANNITYAVFGEAMRYWDFFPAAEGFGRVPVWGFATVEASNRPDTMARAIVGLTREKAFGRFVFEHEAILRAARKAG